jgi:ribonucleoside-diphosphate reductase alpha chain
MSSIKVTDESKNHQEMELPLKDSDTANEMVLDKNQKTDQSGKKMTFKHFFSKPGIDPFDEIGWDIREAKITSEKGEEVFRQNNVEVPKFWSQLATNVVVSKYFHGQIGTPEREKSVKELVNRVSRTIADWGKKDGYFASKQDTDTFYKELTYLLVNQYAAFNSPVWFNVGIEDKPQCSACFINSVEDTMGGILDLAKIEGMLFKYGSGTGTNLSTLRSSKESISGGGIASGPVSFMKGFDAFAGVIKSGGKTRRAAKMVILNVDHPDIMEFIDSKANEEKKAWALINQGYDGGINGEAYGSIFFQNANHSVRVTDNFMKAVENDQIWETKAVKGGKTADKYKAKEIIHRIADGTYLCGDPGMQFDTTINDWHTCSNSARINASNPCSEYMFVDDTACNLASLNLMKFLNEKDEFDVQKFRSAVRVLITAMEIIVDNSSYPREEIAKNSHLFRTLGLGYANLGALIMSRGLPYDSESGRAYAGAITALMTGQAYITSSELAQVVGPFEEYQKNQKPFLNVIQKHRAAAYNLKNSSIPENLNAEAKKVWDEAIEEGKKHGFRNAQVSVLAPTGTIAFLMDCDTTGVEPDIALVKYKALVGGGVLKIVNNTVELALRKLKYNEEQIKSIINYINANDTIEGAPELRDEHLPVFDCAFKPKNGKRSIHYMGHVNMLSATQPFISGAISKTVNVPENITIKEIEDIYTKAWKGGLKAISIYRDNSKRTQPLSTKELTAQDESVDGKKVEKFAKRAGKPYRRRLPDERQAITHKFSIGGHEGYITVGMFEDGSPGEIFIVMAKEGSAVSGLMDAFATAISMTLQYGVPLKVLCRKFAHSRFEPSGISHNPQIPYAKSIMDYIFRWLALKFLTKEEQFGITTQEDISSEDSDNIQNDSDLNNDDTAKSKKMLNSKVDIENESGEPCHVCGHLMVRSGNCHVCLECGSTSGCS